LIGFLSHNNLINHLTYREFDISAVVASPQPLSKGEGLKKFEKGISFASKSSPLERMSEGFAV
jgi:hypothetical protein